MEGGWDADADGVAEGCQHNTMDVEYFGPNPIIQGWYLAALLAGARMADHLSEREFSRRCGELARQGAEWTEAHLFNGDYYEQDIRAPGDFSRVRPELRDSRLGAVQADQPEFQIGSGCLVDQLAGQVSAEIAGLGKIFDPTHTERSLASVHRFNYVHGFSDCANYMSSFVFGEDRGHVMFVYPDGVPEHPMSYWCLLLGGFEYTYALALVQSGHPEAAEDVVRSVRDRYDGRSRNPFDQIECGHHYARAMASWGLIVTATGFHYSAVEKKLEFGCSPSGAEWFWSSGSAWGSATQVVASGVRTVRVEVKHGAIQVTSVAIGGALHVLEHGREFGAGEVITVSVPASPNPS